MKIKKKNILFYLHLFIFCFIAAFVIILMIFYSLSLFGLLNEFNYAAKILMLASLLALLVELLMIRLLILKEKVQLLELYKEFYERLNPTIEHDTTDEDDLPIDFEYLDIFDATDRTLEIVKKIKELENENII